MLSRVMLSNRLGRVLLAPLALGAVLLAAPAEAEGGSSEFHPSFSGSFTLAYGHLSFSGASLPPRYGLDTIDGETDLGPGESPVCYAIIEDQVTITTYDGSELYLENSGEDCLDFSTGAPVIVGSGTTLVLGGTGRFEGAAGQGTYSVSAPVANIGDGTADGAFTLDFDLILDH